MTVLNVTKTTFIAGFAILPAKIVRLTHALNAKTIRKKSARLTIRLAANQKKFVRNQTALPVQHGHKKETTMFVNGRMDFIVIRLKNFTGDAIHLTEKSAADVTREQVIPVNSVYAKTHVPTI